MKKFFNLSNIRLLLICILVFFLYSFSNHRNQNRFLQSSEVLFEGENTNFVTQETVNKLLICSRTNVKTIKKVNLNLKNAEKTLDQHPMIEKSEVYVSVDGRLKARVIQKTPIGRFFTNSDSFYIDLQGNKMPLSNQETARVPLITGEISAANFNKLTPILKQIYTDDFLSKNIIGLQILPDLSVVLKNRNYDYQILFGQLVNIESKFKNYKAFFQKASQGEILKKYSSINLTFKHQVVATK